MYRDLHDTQPHAEASSCWVCLAGVKLPPPGYDQLLGAIRQQCAVHNLQPTDVFLLKVTQLYEMVVVRHGLMLVGQPFSGKCAALKVLAGALTDLSEAGVAGPLFDRVQQVVINPKAVTMGQLYGETSSQARGRSCVDCVFAVV